MHIVRWTDCRWGGSLLTALDIDLDGHKESFLFRCRFLHTLDFVLDLGLDVVTEVFVLRDLGIACRSLAVDKLCILEPASVQKYSTR